MDYKEVEFDLLFEASWEVCNKVGGIYTVLSTKAKTLQELYKDKVIFIGPDVWTEDRPSPFFIEQKTLLKAWRAQLRLPQGVSVRVGRWDVPGRPIAVLVKFDGMYPLNNELYGRMWQLYGVDSLHSYGDYGEACAFSHAAALVIADLARFFGIAQGKKIIAHFDEWTTGMALLCVKAELPQMATVFTTHATSIGRSICGNGKPLYDYLHAYNGDQMARELNMEAKHSLEKTAATQADCFTTVSDVTARECEQLLDRKPDVVTPNGFEPDFVPGPRKYKKQREQMRKLLFDTIDALTGERLPDDTFIMATSGRCEYRNKGIDMYLDAVHSLGELNPSKRVLALVLVPAWVKAPRADLQAAISSGAVAPLPDPVITHTLHNYADDPILARIHGLDFSNAPGSNVTMVYVPCYLNGNDGILNAHYYDLLPALDATVFPSYYEPWGYTPLESVAFGIPTITTSLSGFGQWVLSAGGNSFAASGVRVESRGDFNYPAVTDAIARDLKTLVDAPAADTAAYRAAAEATASRARWQTFIEPYREAYVIALKRAAARVRSDR